MVQQYRAGRWRIRNSAPLMLATMATCLFLSSSAYTDNPGYQCADPFAVPPAEKSACVLFDCTGAVYVDGPDGDSPGSDGCVTTAAGACVSYEDDSSSVCFTCNQGSIADMCKWTGDVNDSCCSSSPTWRNHDCGKKKKHPCGPGGGGGTSGCCDTGNLIEVTDDDCGGPKCIQS